MTEEVKVETPETPEPETPYEKPQLAENPRNQILREIAASAAAKHATDAAETMPSVDDDHNVTQPEPAPAAAAPDSTPSDAPEPPPAAPAGAPSAIDPEGEYEAIVEGQTVKVKGKTIIDAGFRTIQKEAAADHKLQLASRLLEEAEARHRATATPPGAPETPAKPADKTEGELAHALQFGTPEESAAAVRTLLARGISEDRVSQLTEERARLAARDEFEFQRGKSYLAREHKDLMEKPAIRRLFESEDSRLLEAGDRRPYIERYSAIAEQLRKDFGLTKSAPAGSTPAAASPGTAAARKVAKAQAPSVPRTAAARLGEGSGDLTKPKATSDVIAAMAAARGKNRLTEPPNTRR